MTELSADWVLPVDGPPIQGGRVRWEHGEIVAEAEWPAIITPAETQKLRAKLLDPERRTNRAGRKYLLTRVLRCCHCGSQLQSRPRADHVRRYVCSTQIGGCGKLTVVADPVELFVSEAVLHRLESPLLPEAINSRRNFRPSTQAWPLPIRTVTSRAQATARFQR